MTERADTFSPEARAAIMRAVKSTGTRPELKVRRAVRALGRLYRLGGWGLPGKPDLVFPGAKAVIFVHGCFWHGHDCARGARQPKGNAAYWRKKISNNIARDERVRAQVEALGWRALILWECETRNGDALHARLKAFLDVN